MGKLQSSSTAWHAHFTQFCSVDGQNSAFRPDFIKDFWSVRTTDGQLMFGQVLVDSEGSKYFISADDPEHFYDAHEFVPVARAEKSNAE